MEKPKRFDCWMGPGNVQLEDGVLHWKTGEFHNVLWLKQDAPAAFLLEWAWKPLSQEGLAIVFFCARGVHGEDALSPKLTKRNGAFAQYIRGDLNAYHVSYWSPGRGSVNLRKNSGFKLCAIAAHPQPPAPWENALHRYALMYRHGAVTLAYENRIILRSRDTGGEFGPAYVHPGEIGLRMMLHTVEAWYDNIRLSALR